MSQNLNALDLTKLRLGISSTVRDEYIQAIIDGVETELLNTHGIEVNVGDQEHLMFLVDLSAWRYTNEGYTVLPPYLRLRLNNLLLKHESV